MTKTCVVCKKQPVPGDDTRSFHKFPNNLNLREKWKQVTGVTSVTTNSRVCSDHFESYSYHKTDGYTHIRRLLSNAIPNVGCTKVLCNITNTIALPNSNEKMQMELSKQTEYIPNIIESNEDINATNSTFNNIICAKPCKTESLLDNKDEVETSQNNEEESINNKEISLKRKRMQDEDKNCVSEKKVRFMDGMKMNCISRADFISDEAWSRFLRYTICKNSQIAAVRKKNYRRQKKIGNFKDLVKCLRQEKTSVAAEYLEDPQCFHRAIGTVLLIAQFFGILPINNIRDESINKFTFRRFGPRVIYSYFVMFGISVMTSISFIHLLKTLNANSFQTKGGIADATVGAVFYGNSLFGNYLFLRLCRRWIAIQYDWRAMERLIDSGGDTKCKKPILRWRFKLIAGSILSLALLEHILSMINNTPLDMWKGNNTLEDFLIVYTNKSHRFIIRNIDYNFTLGLFIFVISKIATFTWNFTDLFIMLVSTGIAERYKHLNSRITGISPTQLSVADWHELRECYAVLSALVKKVDDEISGIILLSFANNIYFICLQLLNGLSPSSSENPIINSIYFFGSFMFLIGRTTAVTLLTARINDQCKVILPVMYNCPSINYCIEAQRLQQQIATDDVALTGHRFFSITRNFMLAVAGAIVTYEVVLLQFNVALQRDDDSD